MKEYIIYFECFGRNIKIKVKANSIEEAKGKVRDRINFHSITLDNETLSDDKFYEKTDKAFQNLKDILGL